MAIYAKIKGTKQGEIKGGVGAAKFEGQIELFSCEFGLGAPYDVATGQASGRRVARPIHIVKPLDRSSPMLYTSCTTNESLSVEISYSKEGSEHETTVTLILTNAMVRDFNHVGSYDGTAVEKLSLTYTKFEFHWIKDKIMAADDWMNPT